MPLNATVEMGGVNQVTHRVQSLVCRDVTLFFLLSFLVETAAKLRPSLALKVSQRWLKVFKKEKLGHELNCKFEMHSTAQQTISKS